jgi:allantoinase
LLPAFFTGAVKDHSHSPTLVARMTAENPARHFGLYPRKGALAVGADADIAVFCPQERVFEAEKMTSAVKWSPYAGMKMAGFVRATYVRGRKVFENGQVLADAGYGQFVKPG